jgi:hypothetical protein
MKRIATIAAIAASIFIFSCANNRDELKVQEVSINDAKSPVPEGNLNATKEEFAPDTKDIGRIPGQQDEKKKQPSTTQAAKPDWDKKIIKTGNVNLEVKDYNSFYTSLREKVRSLGGYIAGEEQVQSDYKLENSMIIKVPVDQFDNAIGQLTANAQKIIERKITSQDVTTEVIDTKSRMEAKKQVRQRYMDLLNQAKNMTEILTVQSEINGIQEQIESAAGRIEYLSHSSVFSTINLTYFQVLNSAAKETDNLKTASFGEKLKGAFRMGWEIVSNFFIVIVTIWPLLLASFLAFYLYKKLRSQKPKQA